MTDLDAHPVLIYDGRTRLFRTVAKRLAAASSLRVVPWESDPAQAFLDAQFGERPFAFILVEGDQVHVGAETVGRLLRKAGLDAGTARLFERAYPTIAAPFGRAVHGQVPAELSGSFPLDERARAHLASVRRVHDIPVTGAE